MRRLAFRSAAHSATISREIVLRSFIFEFSDRLSPGQGDRQVKEKEYRKCYCDHASCWQIRIVANLKCLCVCVLRDHPFNLLDRCRQVAAVYSRYGVIDRAQSVISRNFSRAENLRSQGRRTGRIVSPAGSSLTQIEELRVRRIHDRRLVLDP
jgi:hypothetical protein